MPEWTVERVYARLLGLMMEGDAEKGTPVRIRVEGREFELSAMSLLPHLTGGVAFIVPDGEEDYGAVPAERAP